MTGLNPDNEIMSKHKIEKSHIDKVRLYNPKISIYVDDFSYQNA